AALLHKCTLYLGNDTGTMHLASAVGVPCVAIFSAADRAGQWEPFGNNNYVLRKRVECEGCGLDICCFQNMCLDLISADEVYAACVGVLEDGGFEMRPSENQIVI
ncbi:MAG TPA: glycosyltransferase family 9 protein, partial [Pyrinomonadaceae bacterium]|nr:glycosyltransferase family 9 protein [Pyrinomonadaceae bacterium]